MILETSQSHRDAEERLHIVCQCYLEPFQLHHIDGTDKYEMNVNDMHVHVVFFGFAELLVYFCMSLPGSMMWSCK